MFLTLTGFELSSPMFMLNKTSSNLKLVFSFTNSYHKYFFFILLKCDFLVSSYIDRFPSSIITTLSNISFNFKYAFYRFWMSSFFINAITSWCSYFFSVFLVMLPLHNGQRILTSIDYNKHFVQKIWLQFVCIGR